MQNVQFQYTGFARGFSRNKCIKTAHFAFSQLEKMVLMRWTTGQAEVISELRFRGAEAIRDAIEQRYGIHRSVHAVEIYASRLGISLRTRTECPECGDIDVKINRLTGLCPKCSDYYHLQEEIAFNEAIMRERIENTSGPDQEQARRDYNAERQRNLRLCKEYGFDSRKLRKHLKRGA